jgi:hypothetical protein
MTLKHLNWRKGLFRLWLVASFIWIVAFGVFRVYPTVTNYTVMSDNLEKLMNEVKDPVIASYEKNWNVRKPRGLEKGKYNLSNRVQGGPLPC